MVDFNRNTKKYELIIPGMKIVPYAVLKNGFYQVSGARAEFLDVELIGVRNYFFVQNIKQRQASGDFDYMDEKDQHEEIERIRSLSIADTIKLIDAGTHINKEIAKIDTLILNHRFSGKEMAQAVRELISAARRDLI